MAKPILGPNGKPYYTTSIHPIAGEHPAAMAAWHKRAAAGFEAEHHPLGRHTAPRFCRGVLSFWVQGRDRDSLGISRQSVWWGEERGDNPSIFEHLAPPNAYNPGSSIKDAFGSITKWSMYFKLPAGYTWAPILTLGSGGRNVLHRVEVLPTDATILLVQFEEQREHAWGQRATVLLFGSSL